MLGHPKSTWVAPIAVSAALLTISRLAACGSDANSASQSVRRVGLMHVGLDHVSPRPSQSRLEAAAAEIAAA